MNNIFHTKIIMYIHIMFYITKRVTAELINVETDHDRNSVNLESDIQFIAAVCKILRNSV